MGILDGDINDQGLLGLYLMAAGAAKPQRTSFGEGLLGGIQMVQQRRMQKEDREAQKRLREMQIGLLGEQVNETRAQAKEREARAMQLAQAQRAQQEFAAALGSVGQTTPAQALSGGGGPTPGNAAAIGQPRPIDWQSLALKYPSQVDLIAKLAETRNLGRDEVARTIETIDPNTGLPATRKETKYGDLVGGVLPKPVEPKEVRQGDRVSFVNPYTSGALPIFQSPDSAASVAATLRGQNMADARSREANSIQDQLRALQAAKLTNELKQTADSKEKAAATAKQAYDTLDNMLLHPGLDTAVGTSGQVDPRNYMWGTKAAGAQALIEQAQGQAFLQAFETLKGGGQITEQEGKAATNAMARLQRKQSDEDFRGAAKELQKILADAYKKASGQDLLKRVTSDAEYDALQSGDIFIDPNGQRRRKP